MSHRNLHEPPSSASWYAVWFHVLVRVLTNHHYPQVGMHHVLARILTNHHYPQVGMDHVMAHILTNHHYPQVGMHHVLAHILTNHHHPEVGPRYGSTYWFVSSRTTIIRKLAFEFYFHYSNSSLISTTNPKGSAPVS
jgi:hypothetical protein